MTEKNDGRSNEEIVAIMKGTVLQRFIVKASKFIQDRLSPDSRFMRTDTVRDHGVTLVFQSRNVETTVSGYGEVKDQRLLLPLENFSPQDLLIHPLSERKDAETGFVYAGVNSTGIIRGLKGKQISGIPIAELEKRMRPGDFSNAGFLGKEESLIDVLAKDNDWVLAHGLTHQQLAEILHRFRALSLLKLDGEGKEIEFRGQKYEVRSASCLGVQSSPFPDGDNTNLTVAVNNLSKGQSLSFSGLLPFLIERYGFYEGEGTSYRVSPQAIAEMFGLVPFQETGKEPHGI